MQKILILNSNLISLLCKLYFDKAVNIGRNSFVLKICFHLNKTFMYTTKLYFKLLCKT